MPGKWTYDSVEDSYRNAPPIVQAAISAILEHEARIDDMGYDISYYQEDLPRVVTDAIAPWKGM